MGARWAILPPTGGDGRQSEQRHDLRCSSASAQSRGPSPVVAQGARSAPVRAASPRYRACRMDRPDQRRQPRVISTSSIFAPAAASLRTILGMAVARQHQDSNGLFVGRRAPAANSCSTCPGARTVQPASVACGNRYRAGRPRLVGGDRQACRISPRCAGRGHHRRRHRSITDIAAEEGPGADMTGGAFMWVQ